MEIVNLKPYLPKDFNLDSIVYSEVQHDGPNKKSIYLYDSVPGKKIYIQSPELKNMIGFNKKSKYYELNLPLYGRKKSHVSSFINFIKDLDNKIITDAKINRNTWFNESNKNVRYRSLIKNIHNDYIDTIEFRAGMFENGIIKLKITNGTPITANSENISIEDLKINHDIRTIFQVYAIWISNDLFGLYLKPVKIDQKYKIVEQVEWIPSDSEKDTVYNTDIDNLSEGSDESKTNSSTSPKTNSNSHHYMNETNIINIENDYNEHFTNIFGLKKIKSDEDLFQDKNSSDSISIKNLSDSIESI
jgi:hypothetical protein